MQEIKYPYKPKPFLFLFAAVFFGACALIIGHNAMTNDRGLILNGILEFSENGATIFYWTLTVISVLIVFIAIFAVIKGIISKLEIIISETAISLPKNGFSRKIITINFSHITDVSIQSVQKQKFLTIIHSAGKLSIPGSMLPQKGSFDELAALVTEKVNSR
ncbi:MAG: hypothetical protein GY754_24985 [bacterium]|nr:hypothetical protein [bacterium]